VVYKLTEDDSVVALECVMETENTGSLETIVNLTNHAHFNLSGDSDLRNHRLVIPGQSGRVCVDDTQFANGGVVSLQDELECLRFDGKGRVLDALGSMDTPQNFGGIDHYFLLGGDGMTRTNSRSDRRNVMNVAAVLSCGNVELRVSSSFCGLQVYTGNQMGVLGDGRGGNHSCIALEASYPPNAVNLDDESRMMVVLHQGEKRVASILYEYRVCPE